MNSKYQNDIVNNLDRHRAVAHFATLKVRAGEWPALVFVREKEHGMQMADALGETLGCTVDFISSDMPQGDRDRIVERMRQLDARTKIAVCTDVWGTGIDIKPLRAVFMAGGGQAPVGLRQRAGRALRVEDGKSSYTIYDVADIGAGSATDCNNARRMEHYDRAGFKIDDRAAMQRLIEVGKTAQSRGRGEISPEDLSPLGQILYHIAMFLTPNRIIVTGLILLFIAWVCTKV